MILVQILSSVFFLFVVSRVVLQFKERKISLVETMFWVGIFCAAFLAILFPNYSTNFANLLGIGRGSDLIVYVSIVVLFYLVFRIYVYLEDLRHEITRVVRGMALENIRRKNK